MGKALKVHLLIIDPQNDFMNNPVPGVPNPGLPVPGATEDMQRVAELIDRVGPRLADIHVTMDSHQKIDVGHPGMWRNENGDKPGPFTPISEDDIVNNIWTPRSPTFRKRMIEYARALKVGGKYQIMVWPEHCLIGTPGHAVQPDLMASLLRWAEQAYATIDFVTKGTNPFTEHYGALMAEVPDPDDPSTMLNTGFLQVIQEADIVGVAGEALSHCELTTVDQIADNIGEEHIRKFHILTNCSSPVPKVGNGPDFPAIAKSWLKQMKARGMTLTTSTEFLK